MSKLTRIIVFTGVAMLLIYTGLQFYFWHSDYQMIGQIKSDFNYLKNYYKEKNTYPMSQEFYSQARTSYSMSNSYNYHDPKTYADGIREKTAQPGFSLLYRLWSVRDEAIGSQISAEGFGVPYVISSCDIGGDCRR